MEEAPSYGDFGSRSPSSSKSIEGASGQNSMERLEYGRSEDKAQQYLSSQNTYIMSLIIRGCDRLLKLPCNLNAFHWFQDISRLASRTHGHSRKLFFFAYASLTQVDRSPKKESEQRLPVPRPRSTGLSQHTYYPMASSCTSCSNCSVRLARAHGAA